MKKILLANCFCFILFSVNAQSITLEPNTGTQTNKKDEKSSKKEIICNYTNKQRYKIDYEIKDNANPSDQQINDLELLKLETHRKENASVEVTDAKTGQKLILYSVADAMKKEAESKYFIDFITKLYFVEN